MGTENNIQNKQFLYYIKGQKSFERQKEREVRGEKRETKEDWKVE